jgi:acyl-CoA synthetase (AMP-forming)/AMP-acid ligase II
MSRKTDQELSVRPDAHSWAAKEIVGHLRDVEELFQIRFHKVVVLDEPHILVFGASATDLAPWRVGGSIGHPIDPERWAVERLYLRNDTPDVADAGTPGRHLRRGPGGFVAPRPRWKLSEASLLEHCRAKLVAFKVAIVVVDAVPRNANGKLDRYAGAAV